MGQQVDGAKAWAGLVQAAELWGALDGHPRGRSLKALAQELGRPAAELEETAVLLGQLLGQARLRRGEALALAPAWPRWLRLSQQEAQAMVACVAQAPLETRGLLQACVARLGEVA